MSDIIIFALIKEGEKLIKSIKYLLWRSYEFGDFVKAMYVIRQQLITFQIFLDKLADTILKKLLIDVNENTEKKLFDEKVENMLKYLNKSVYNIHLEFENGNNDNISTLVKNEPDIFFGNQFYFDEFYFAFPIMHVYEFISFINHYM